MAVKKARRVTKPAKPEEKDLDPVRLAVERVEAWRSISDTDFAKHFVEVLKEIENQTYGDVANQIFGSLDRWVENPVNLVRFVATRQGRLIAVQRLREIFFADDKTLKELSLALGRIEHGQK